jgi:hypothetical protein
MRITDRKHEMNPSGEQPLPIAVSARPEPALKLRSVQRSCGLLFAVERGDQSDITCNECGLVFKSVPTADNG